MTIDVRRIDLLATDPESERLAHEFIQVQERNSRALWGDDHGGWSLAELQGRRRGTTHRFVDLIALDAEKVVGMTALAMPLTDNTHLGFFTVRTDPGHERSGVGSALVAAVEEYARAAGRTTLEADTETRQGEPATSEEFAHHRGYAPAQVMVRSEMRLPADEVRLQELADGDGVEDAAAFSIESRVDDIPDEWLPGLAELERRMSLDAPQGDRDAEEEEWTPQRVREDLQWALDAGRRILLSVAWEGERMVGFTNLEIPSESPWLAFQQDTLVLREARGHRLGVRLKAANARELQREFPGVRTVLTWNAEDNVHMLAANADLGYERTGTLTLWKKALA
ncbi:GNAT family N-acetyltransferase [Calidifontibacter terrae]